MQRYAAVQADVLEFLRTQPDNSFDALLTDPPYGLRFMNRKWDYEVPSVAMWAECLRVLKPGAPLLSFGGSRTFHRIATGLEDGGFELCDTIFWVYGQGMPKPATTTDKYIDKALKVERPVVGTRQLTGNAAVDTKTKGGTYGIQVGTVAPKTVAVTAPGSPLSAAWEGYGHALRPSHEPIILACKPFEGSIAENILEHGVGGLNLGPCRIGTSGGTRKVDPERYRTEGNALRGSVDGSLNGGVKEAIAAGRWPANVILSHSPDCVSVGTREVRGGVAVKRNGVHTDSPVLPGGLGCYPEGTPDHGFAVGGKETVEMWACVPGCPVRQMDDQSGTRPSTLAGRADPTKSYANPGDNGGASQFGGSNSRVYADTGGASRFFYHAKVNRKEREFGCENLPLRTAAECTGRTEGLVGADRPQAGAGRGSGARNFHPTLKPIELNRYLATLLRPPNPDAVLLVPYAGVASEMIGALLAGWPAVLGIESGGENGEYMSILHARVRAWCPEADIISL